MADVTKTKPIQSIESAQTLVVTQVHHVAVEMYLLAVKSFVLQYGPCKIEIVNDGSLTPDDLSLLNTHIENLTVVDIGEIDVFNCPTGACWERLHYVLSRTDEYYVIQLDMTLSRLVLCRRSTSMSSTTRGSLSALPCLPSQC